MLYTIYYQEGLFNDNAPYLYPGVLGSNLIQVTGYP